MRHIDVGGHIDIPYKKIGITGDGNSTLSSRLQQISNTKSPIKAQCIAAWGHDDARAVESALHALLADSQVEGEWFLDKDDTLVERMQPIMDLIGASIIHIEESNDAYTQNALKNESAQKQKQEHILLGEISELLHKALRSSSRFVDCVVTIFIVKIVKNVVCPFYSHLLFLNTMFVDVHRILSKTIRSNLDVPHLVVYYFPTKQYGGQLSFNHTISFSLLFGLWISCDNKFT